MANYSYEYSTEDSDDEIDIQSYRPNPFSHENIANLDIKSLNKLIQNEGLTKEESNQIKEVRRRARMKEYSRKRREKEENEIRSLEKERVRLAKELGEISNEVSGLKNLLKRVY